MGCHPIITIIVIVIISYSNAFKALKRLGPSESVGDDDIAG
jgi:hypothetical protein